MNFETLHTFDSTSALLWCVINGTRVDVLRDRGRVVGRKVDTLEVIFEEQDLPVEVKRAFSAAEKSACDWRRDAIAAGPAVNTITFLPDPHFFSRE